MGKVDVEIENSHGTVRRGTKKEEVDGKVHVIDTNRERERERLCSCASFLLTFLHPSEGKDDVGAQVGWNIFGYKLADFGSVLGPIGIVTYQFFPTIFCRSVHTGFLTARTRRATPTAAI